MIKRFVAALMFSSLSTALHAATYYVSPVGSDSASGTSSDAFKTLSRAFSVGSGGDTYILKPGTYNYPGCELNGNIKSGSAGAYTVIKAEIDGTAVISQTNGLSMRDDSTPLQQYIRVEGIKFEGAYEKTIYGDHIKFLRCGFKGGPSSGNTMNTLIGGNSNGSNLSRHILLEDCWFYGSGGRYKLLVFNSENIVLRRIVIRNDGGWNDAPNSGNPEACFALYNSSDCEIQGMVLIDSDQNYYEYTQAFYFIHNPSANPDHPTQGNRMRGVVIANTRSVGFRADAKDSTDNLLEDAVVVNSEDWAYSWGSNSNTTFTANRVAAVRRNFPFTAVSGSGGYGYWGAGGGVTITNSIIANYSTGPDYNNIALSHFNTYNNGSTTSGTGQKTYNPGTNGWLYPVRIEAGSPLRTAGLSGGQIGPRIETRIGASGTLWGESGYNTDTGEPLWPWPNEARIVTDMCADTKRGFCGRNSLTQYVWELLGHASPLPNPAITLPNSNLGTTDQGSTAQAGKSPDNLKPGVSFLMPSFAADSKATFGSDAQEVVIQNDRGRTVFHRTKSGASSIVWDGKGPDGRIVESGAYICKIRGSGDKVVFHLLTVVK